jgi:OmpA-OmpF porin, OOP family
MFKNKILVLTLVFAGLCCTATPAHAQTSRVYFAGYMGLNNLPSMDFTESSVPASGSVKFDNSLSFAGALGIRMSKNFRLEGEISYSKSDLDRIDINGAGSFKAGGSMTQWLGLANVYYDFNVPWRVQPFIGAGLGMAFVDGDVTDISGFSADSSGSTTALAWQLGFGAKYRMSPDLALSAGYRWLDTSDLDFGSYSIDYGNHEFRVGIEYDLPISRGD